VFERIRRTRHVVVFEGTQDEHDCVDLADVGKKLVAEAFALAGALDETADVDHLNRGVDRVLGLRHDGQTIEAGVGHLGNADVRVFGGKGIRGGQGSATGEGVVERGLARVGEADQAEAFHGPPRVPM